MQIVYLKLRCASLLSYLDIPILYLAQVAVHAFVRQRFRLEEGVKFVAGHRRELARR